MMKHFPLVLLIFIASCGPRPKESAGIPEQLDAYFQTQFPPDEPGGAVLISREGQTLFANGYGLADVTTKEPITPHTLFNLGSISKTFVANAILMLQEQGKLSVEDDLEKYFPQFKNKAIAHKVKIRHLLTHTSGLPDNRQLTKDSVFYLTARDAENWFPVTQTDTLVFEPGVRFEYSNPAYDGLALIVEKVSGMKWQQFIEENIMKPSGMSFSTITDGPWPERGVSHAYLRSKGKWIERDYMEEPTFAAAGNGGVWSSVEELEKYEKSLEEHRWLRAETIAQSRSVQQPPNWTEKNPAFIGWSWFIGNTADSLKTVGHTGTQGGFLATYLTIPEKKIHLFILCNTPRDLGEIARHALQILAKK